MDEFNCVNNLSSYTDSSKISTSCTNLSNNRQTIADLFNSMFVSFSNYPPEIYNENKKVYILMCLLLFPSVILPYQIMMNKSTLRERLLLILLSLFILKL